MRPNLLLYPVVALTLFAQTPAPEQPVSHPNSRLVEVNVVVHDKSGPVSGLTQSDFTIFDKGKEQKIASFTVSKTAPAQQSKLPANVFSNRPDTASGPSGITAILLDSLNTPPQAQAFARAQFVRALGEIKPQENVTVYVLGTQLTHIANLSRNAEGEPNSLETVLADNSVVGGMNTEQQLRLTTDALVTISNHIARVRGRKNLVWIAGAYPVSVDHYGAEGGPGWENAAVQQTSARSGGISRPAGDPTSIDRSVFQKLFAPAMQAIAMANVAVYSVDCRGLVDVPTSQTAAGGGSRTRGSSSGDASLVPIGTNVLRIFSDDTGGRSFESSNDFQKAIRTAVDDTAVSYTIGFYPDAKNLDSRFHDLKVTASRKDLDVHVRKGYLAFPEAKTGDAQRTEAIRQAILAPFATDGIGIMAGYEKVNEPKPNTLRTTVVINGSDILLTKNDSQWVGEFELILSPRGSDGKDRGTFRQPVGLKLTQEQYDMVMKQGLSLNKTVEATGEVGELRVVVADRSANRIGSLVMPIK